MSDPEPLIAGEIEIAASRRDVWRSWTTEDGARAFFAPDCRIEARPGGPYELYFQGEAEAGRRGSEGMIVLAVQPERLFSFTWSAPPHLPEARAQMTHVTVRLDDLGGGRTRVRLRHDGWGEGGEWDQARAYFERAWKQVVLPRLKRRHEVGPIDWSAPSPAEPTP